jgi:hypothetical protein
MFRMCNPAQFAPFICPGETMLGSFVGGTFMEVYRLRPAIGEGENKTFFRGFVLGETLSGLGASRGKANF